MPLPISSSVALKTGSSRRYEVWPSSVNSYSCSRRRSQPLSSSSDSSSAKVAGSTSRWTRAKASTSSSWETGPLLSRFMTSHCRRVIPCSSSALPKCSLINLSTSRNQKSTGRRGGCIPRRGGMGGSSAVTATSLPSDEFCNAHTLLARGSSSQSLSAGALAPHSRRCAACSTAAAECAGYPKNESEIVPVAVVVHLVDVHVWVEQRHHERDRADQPLPQTQPETGRFRVRAGKFIRPSSARSEQQQCSNERYGALSAWSVDAVSFHGFTRSLGGFDPPRTGPDPKRDCHQLGIERHPAHEGMS